MASSQHQIFGRLPSEYRHAHLSEICEENGIQTGPFGSQLHKEDYVSSGTPIVTVEHLGENRFTHQNLPFVSPQDVVRLAKYKLKEGDIVFSRVGSVDRRALVRDEEDGWLFSGRCLRVRPRQDIVDSLWLSFLLGTDQFRNYIRSVAVGATMPSINTKILSNAPIFLPPLAEQRAIAETLGALDDRIDNLRQTNVTLQAVAAALFKSWFVDFDGVAHEDLQESELGLIPKGWRESTVGEHFNLIMGQSPPGETYNEFGDGIPFYQGRTDFSSRFPVERVYCTAPTRLAQRGDVLVSVRAPVGDINVALTDCAIGRGVASVHSNQASFALYTLLSLKPSLMKYESEGTVFGSINKDQFRALQIIAPPDEVVSEFQSIVQPIDVKIENNEIQARTLTNLRDTLLPRLISGKLRIRDVVQQIAEVST